MGTLIREDLSLFEDRIDEITAANSYAEVKETINLLKGELRRNKDLVCLCAPQINKMLRIFVVKTADNKYRAFLNPMIVEKSKEMHLSRERSASIPNKDFIVVRNDEVHVAFQESNGRVGSESYKGAYGEVVQQMIQMLDGITLDDLGMELDDDFDSLTDAKKRKLIELYLDYLKDFSSELNEEIENNPQLKQINDTINFNTQYLLGNVKPVDAEGNVVEPTTGEELEEVKPEDKVEAEPEKAE